MGPRGGLSTQSNLAGRPDEGLWAGSTVGWAYLVSVIDCCTREIVGWDLSNRCRTEEALAAVERAVPERLPAGSRGAGLTLTTDNVLPSLSSFFAKSQDAQGSPCWLAAREGVGLNRAPSTD